MRDGKSESAAVRDALIDASKIKLYEQAAADAERIAADPAERAEIAAIGAFFDAVNREE